MVTAITTMILYICHELMAIYRMTTTKKKDENDEMILSRNMVTIMLLPEAVKKLINLTLPKKCLTDQQVWVTVIDRVWRTIL